MTRDILLDGFLCAPGPGRRRARLGIAILAAVLAPGLALPPGARGAGIFHDLSARDRAHPILLSQTGEAISLRSPGHPAAGLASGGMPAYLAFPLLGGEHLPAHVPTVTTGPQPGETAVGPMDLSPTSQSQLNADLRAARGVIVQSPDGSFAVAMLPRYARALAHAAASRGGTNGGDSGLTSVASVFGLTPQANWTIQGVPASKLSQWIRTGTKEIAHLTSQGLDGVSRPMGLKVTPTTVGYNVAPAAEELIPPTSARPAGGIGPVATPEPAGWLVFGLLVVAAGLRRRFP